MKSAILLLPLLLLGQSVAVKREATWTHDGKDVNGNPEVVTIWEVAIAPPVVDLGASPQLAFGGIQRVPDSAVKQQDGTFLYPFATLIAQLGDGIYTLWVRAEDESGNKSVWAKTDFRLDKTSPTSPANLKIRVTIEIIQ